MLNHWIFKKALELGNRIKFILINKLNYNQKTQIEDLQLAGFWKEFYYPDFLPSVQYDLAHPEKLENKQQILKFLNQGQCVTTTRGFAYCPFTKLFLGADSLYTDGHWLWTESLIEYFRHCDIRMDDHFVEHMEFYNFKCPRISNKMLRLIADQVMHFRRIYH